MNEMSINGIYMKGYADGYKNGRMSKEPVFFPPCIDCNKKMDEVRKAYDSWKAKEFDIIAELEKIKAEIGKEFVDLQDGSEEWRSYVNESVLECYEIVDKHIAELKEK